MIQPTGSLVNVELFPSVWRERSCSSARSKYSCSAFSHFLLILSLWRGNTVTPSSSIAQSNRLICSQDPDERKPLLPHPNPVSKPPNGTDWTANVPSARNDEQALLTSILTKTAQ